MKKNLQKSSGIKMELTLKIQWITSLMILVLAFPIFVNAQNSPTNLAYSVPTGISYHKLPNNSVCPTVSNGGATVTYSLTNAPSGVSISPASGQISWDATVGVGHYTITVVATNNVGSVNANYDLNVIPNPDDFLTVKYTSATISNCTYANASKSTYAGVDIYYPSNDTNTQRPVFMFMHGGGFQTSGTKTESYVVSFCKYMATCGFVAFAPNYNEGGGHTLSQNLAACKDMDACLNSIRNRTITMASGTLPKYNPEFLFIGGGSAGGHLSSNFTFFDSTANYGGYIINLQNVISEADCWGSSPTTDRLYNFANLRSNEIPTFIVQGSADQTVPVSNSIALDAALTSAGAYHHFWEITGETHGCPGHIGPISDTMAHFQNKAWKRLYPQTVNAVCVVTPVKLSYFGVASSDGLVEVKWTTSIEENVNHYEIERSSDGKYFTTIGLVNSKGNSSTAVNYIFKDDAGKLAGTVYYRLKSVDNNGALSYTEVSVINIKATRNIVVNTYPNPLKSGQKLKLKYIAVKADNVVFGLTNTFGQKINNQVLPVNEGINDLTLNTGNLKSGIYYLSVIVNNTTVQNLPVVVE